MTKEMRIAVCIEVAALCLILAFLFNFNARMNSFEERMCAQEAFEDDSTLVRDSLPLEEDGMLEITVIAPEAD